MKTYTCPELICIDHDDADILTFSVQNSGRGADWDWSEQDNNCVIDQ